jgi:hypothetical protein
MRKINPLLRKSPEEECDQLARKVAPRLHNSAQHHLALAGVILTPDESHVLFLDLVQAVVVALEKAAPRTAEEMQRRIKRNLDARADGSPAKRSNSISGQIAAEIKAMHRERERAELEAAAAPIKAELARRRQEAANEAGIGDLI